MNNLWLFLLAVLLIGFVCFSCNQSSDDDDDKLTGAECLSIREDCKASSKTASEEYQCILTEPESPNCLIEKEGYYNQTYHDCVKSKVGSECQGSLLWQYQCLANCYYEKLDYETYEQAEEECMDLCVYSVDY